MNLGRVSLSALLAPIGWLMGGTMKKMLRKDLEDLATSIHEGN
jgi:hypothetical protein